MYLFITFSKLIYQYQTSISGIVNDSSDLAHFILKSILGIGVFLQLHIAKNFIK